MGRSGADAIADAIRTNSSIRELILEIEPGDHTAAQEIANALRSNTTITEIFLGDRFVVPCQISTSNGLVTCEFCSGAIDPEIAESFANTLRINKFIAGVSNRQPGTPQGQARPPPESAHSGGDTPTVDAVVIAMNERLKGMQQQLTAHTKLDNDQLPNSPDSGAQPTRAIITSVSPAAVQRQGSPSQADNAEFAASVESSLIQKVSSMIDQRMPLVGSPHSSQKVAQFGAAQVERLQQRLQEQSHQIEELTVAVAHASSKADDAEVT